MADNVLINIGLGTTVSAKDQGDTAEVQRMVPTDDGGLTGRHFASDEALVLLRRLVKLAEARMSIDTVFRQRIDIDGWGGANIAMNTGTASTTNIIVDANLDINDPINTCFTISVPRITLTTTAPVATIALSDRMQFIDMSRETAADSFRSYLKYS
jgi:hypothetical protein